MRQRFFLATLLAIGLAFLFIGNAAAGGCGYCGYAGYYVPYTVQPKLIVRRPLVVLRPYFLFEYVHCGNGYVVNQGQYHTDATLIARPRCFFAPAW
jgi:hypothetical protein